MMDTDLANFREMQRRSDQIYKQIHDDFDASKNEFRTERNQKRYSIFTLYPDEFDYIYENYFQERRQKDVLSGIPDKYKNATLDSWLRVTPTGKKIKGYDELKSKIEKTTQFRFSYWCGETGLGKTHCLYALARKHFDKQYTYITYKKLEGVLQGHRLADDEGVERTSYSHLEGLCQGKNFVFVDDFNPRQTGAGGVQEISYSIASGVYELIKLCEENNKTLIIVSNLHVLDLSQAFGFYADKIERRFREGIGQIANFEKE